jgi:hypothetical protein
VDDILVDVELEVEVVVPVAAASKAATATAALDVSPLDHLIASVKLVSIAPGVYCPAICLVPPGRDVKLVKAVNPPELFRVPPARNIKSALWVVVIDPVVRVSTKELTDAVLLMSKTTGLAAPTYS